MKKGQRMLLRESGKFWFLDLGANHADLHTSKINEAQS